MGSYQQVRGTTMSNKSRALGITAAIFFAIAFLYFLVVVTKGLALVALFVAFVLWVIYLFVLDHLDESGDQ